MTCVRGRHDLGDVMTIEYPVTSWSIMLDQPGAEPVELLRHNPLAA